MNINETKIVDTRKSKTSINKKIKPIPAGSGKISLQVNTSFEAQQEHNNKRWVKITHNIHINTPVHASVKMFFTEKEIYIQNLKNDTISKQILIDQSKLLYNDVNRFMKNNLDQMFHSGLTFPADPVVSKEVEGFLNAFFFSSNFNSLS